MKHIQKIDTYDKDGILQNMDVWDWIVTKTGRVRQITHHDMMDLKAEDIARYATKKEIISHKRIGT